VTPALIAPALVGLLVGLILGCIPFVQDLTGMRFYGLVPFAAPVIGAAAGFLMFHVAKVVNVRVDGLVGVLLGLAAGLGYVCTDVGKYYTKEIELAPEEGQAKVPMKLSALMPFGTYMDLRLSGSSIGRRRAKMDVGGGMAKLLYVVDIGAAACVAWFMLLGLAGSNPYCGRCTRYKKKGKSFEISVPDAEDAAKPLLEGLAAGVQKNDYAELAQFLKKSHGEQTPGNLQRKLECTEHCCEGCKEATLAGELKAKNEKGEWSSVDGSAFSVDSASGAGFQI
jgi:hypothetical protein